MVFSPGVLPDHFPIPTPLAVKHLQVLGVSRQVGLTGDWGAGVGVGTERKQRLHWVFCLFDLPANLVGGGDVLLAAEPMLPEFRNPSPFFPSPQH